MINKMLFFWLKLDVKDIKSFTLQHLLLVAYIIIVKSTENLCLSKRCKMSNKIRFVIKKHSFNKCGYDYCFYLANQGRLYIEEDIL